MKTATKSSLMTMAVTLLVTALTMAALIANDKVAWVTKTTFPSTSDQFTGTATCQEIHYAGVHFGHTVVTGHVSLGGGSGAYGGVLTRTEYTLAGREFDSREATWGGASYYDAPRAIDDRMVADACYYGKAN